MSIMRIFLFLNNDVNTSNYIRIVSCALLRELTLKWSFNNQSNFT